MNIARMGGQEKVKITFSIESILQKNEEKMRVKSVHINTSSGGWRVEELSEEKHSHCCCSQNSQKREENKQSAEEKFFSKQLKSRRIGHPYRNRAPPKRKPPRNTFTQSQIIQLEHLFQHTKYLSSNQRLHLSKQLDMSDNQLKTWYQNRRTKLKREINELNEQRLILHNTGGV